jgi:hypothetical protein
MHRKGEALVLWTITFILVVNREMAECSRSILAIEGDIRESGEVVK